jgi:hypothetical protein
MTNGSHQRAAAAMTPPGITQWACMIVACFFLRHAERLEPSGHDGQWCNRDRRRA